MLLAGGESLEDYQNRAFMESTMSLGTAAGLLGITLEELNTLIVTGFIKATFLFEGPVRVDRASLTAYARSKKEEHE